MKKLKLILVLICTAFFGRINALVLDASSLPSYDSFAPVHRMLMEDVAEEYVELVEAQHMGYRLRENAALYTDLILAAMFNAPAAEVAALGAAEKASFVINYLRPIRERKTRAGSTFEGAHHYTSHIRTAFNWD